MAFQTDAFQTDAFQQPAEPLPPGENNWRSVGLSIGIRLAILVALLGL
jgi:hypothetical protein